MSKKKLSNSNPELIHWKLESRNGETFRTCELVTVILINMVPTGDKEDFRLNICHSRYSQSTELILDLRYCYYITFSNHFVEEEYKI